MLAEIQNKKLEIIQALTFLDDESVLSEIEQIIAAVAKPIQPMSISEFYERINKSEKSIEQGNIVSQDDLEKESENW